MEGSDAGATATGGRWVRAVTVRATIGHPVEQVFAHLADPTRWPAFVPAVVLRRPMGDELIGIGSRWMATDRIGPVRIHFVDELAELVPNRRVVWLSSAPWNARVEYDCAGDGRTTRVEARYSGDLGGPVRWLLGWLPSWATRWILAQDFRRLDRLLTREARAVERWLGAHDRGPMMAASLPRTDSQP